jgi:uncharacterized protein
METKTVIVEGMTCNHCKANVERGIKGIEGVKDAVVDLESQSVKIEAESVDLDKVKLAVEKIGYKFAGSK